MPKNLLEKIAVKLAAKVTAEDQIEGAVGELDNLPFPITEFSSFLQQEGDRRVTEAQRAWQQEQQETGDEEEDTDDPVPTPPPATPGKPVSKGKKPNKGGDDPIAKLTNVVSQLATTVANMQKDGVQKTLTEQLHSKLGDKKIPLVFAKGRTVDKADDLETVLAEIEADYAEVKQGFNNDGLNNMSTPSGGTTGNPDKTKGCGRYQSMVC